MDLLKCACGCDKLSKDELEKIINSTHRVKDFLNNKEAVDMFKTMFATTPTPKAVFYLEYINMAKGFMENPSRLNVEDDSHGTLMGSIDEQFADDLYNCTNDASKTAVLEKIINEYSLRLSMSEEYKKFQEKLKKAYQGKETIRKSD
ncbi:uncharacterized protein LOC131284528 [Anopheles ziemanni]|uniref:uncharacterized protein LOC131272253 n=1 Tax=Anopheles coustani TaxID=139045 RepID=UPI002657BD6A|nr:uncharacterized protein LOC131272253 [Anopheles coustani]XP_058169369.1 uncharacterized protein LOC131284528 [Anopheles ziemanni]